MTVSTNEISIQEALTRSIDKIYPTKTILGKEMFSGRRLRIYLGIDPTSPHLHIGHATSLWILRRFQKLGHEIIFLIGDFTARIGDPSDKLSPRQPLTEEEIKINLKTFKEQAAKIVDFSGLNAARLKFNSKWQDKMTFKELINLAQNFTVQQMIERDMFQKRLNADKPIGLHEFLYPLMQGYDSVAMDVDIEVGGTDQTFNMLAGRTLMKKLKNKEKFVITNKLLVDAASGKKLSKTEGNLINLDDAPNDMFGKVMALPDSMISAAAELSTQMPMTEIKNLEKMQNPRDAKLILAFEMVKTYHKEKEAENAKEEWIKTNSEKEIPTDIEVKEVSKMTLTSGTLAVLTTLGIKSKSEGRRLLVQGAIEVDGKTVKDPKEKRKSGEVIKIGKHRFFRIG